MAVSSVFSFIRSPVLVGLIPSRGRTAGRRAIARWRRYYRECSDQAIVNCLQDITNSFFGQTDIETDMAPGQLAQCGEAVGYLVDEHAQAVAHVAVGRIHDVEGGGRRLPVLQQRYQRAAVDVLLGGDPEEARGLMWDGKLRADAE
jgi:hypothetical protein